LIRCALQLLAEVLERVQLSAVLDADDEQRERESNEGMARSDHRQLDDLLKRAGRSNRGNRITPVLRDIDRTADA